MQEEKDGNGSFDERRWAIQDDYNRLQEKSRRLESERDTKYLDYVQQNRDSQNKNDLARFGPNVPMICETIKHHANKFQVVPIGPLGLHINLRDE